MNKVIIISDLSLQIFLSNRVDFIYTDDILLYLKQSSFKESSNYVIFFDCYTKVYDDKYLIELFSIVFNLRIKYPKCKFWVTDLFFNASVPIGNMIRIAGTGYSDALFQLLNEVSGNEYTIRLSSYILLKGQANIYNHLLMTSYQLPYDKVVIEDFESILLEEINLHNEAKKKVIILDCDNTLWGGILGEDLIDGISCDRADGRLFHEFQLFIKNCKEAGFVLALNTKNNENEVIHAFFEKSMPLKIDDFVTIRSNWNSKSSNIKSIVSELNVGYDSLVFIDDNPSELAEVKSVCPEVYTIQFQNDWDFLFKLRRNRLFVNWNWSNEDKKKSELYKAETLRKQLVAQYDSNDDYLSSLSIKLTLLEDFPKPRLIQLSEKTNQFNFNKKILDDAAISNYESMGHKFLMFSLSDKFGDYGIIGYTHINDLGELQNFVLSCRALGKKVENRIIKILEDNYLSKRIFHFKKTTRNKPAEIFAEKFLKEWNIK